MTQLTQKTCYWLLALALLLAACAPSSFLEGQAKETTASPAFPALPTLTPAATVNGQPIFTTIIGDLTIDSVRWVEEVNGVMPGLDEKLLLIAVSKPGEAKLDPSTFSLQDFDRALRDQTNGEVHIGGEDGAYIVCSMAGWVGDQDKIFAMGFRVPKDVSKLQLIWPGNAPIDLYPEN